MLIDVEQFLLENVIGELRLHLANALPVQVCLSRFHRPGHHVDMWMVTLVVERCIPPEVLRRNVHGCRDVVAVRTEQSPPRLRVVVTKTLRVLPMQGDDVRPDISGIVFQFRHGGIQIHMIRVTEQAVVTQTLRTRTCRDVLHVAIRLLHLLPVFLQRQRDERRGVGFRGLLHIVLILQQFFHIREVFRQLCDELFLLAGWRTVIRDDLHPFPRCNVAKVTVGVLLAALDIRTFDDQSCHPSSPSRCSCARFAIFSSCRWPLSFFTRATLSACFFRRYSSSRWTQSARTLTP